MTARVFIDTNVLIYARDARNQAKRERAKLWLSALAVSFTGRVNLQVLNELTRWLLKNEPHRPLVDVQEDIDDLSSWGDQAIEPDDVELAWAFRAQTGYEWFDCLLLAAADRLDCQVFLTEDMTDGARVGSLVLVNPFRASPSDVLRQH